MNEDLISRQAAIEIASGYCHPANIAKELERLPSAEPERNGRCSGCTKTEKPTVDKGYLIRLIQEAVEDGEACARLIDMVDRPRGKWSRQTTDYFDYFECSECGIGVGLDDIKNFCPNCGADMRGDTAEP